MLHRYAPLLLAALLPACASSSPAVAETPTCPEPAAPMISKAAAPADRHIPNLDGDAVRVSYWVVASNADGLDGFPVPAEVAKLLGDAAGDPTSLKVLDASAIDSMPEMKARTNGPHSEFEQVVFRTGEPLVLDLQIRTALRTGIESRVSLTPGELTLVGSGAYQHSARDEPATVGRVFYVVKAEPAPAHAKTALAE